MVEKKGKPAASTRKSGSVVSQAEQTVDPQQVVDLLTRLLQKTSNEREPEIPEAVRFAIDQFNKIDTALRVPAQSKPIIDDPKWVLPPLNPRTIRPGEK